MDISSLAAKVWEAFWSIWPKSFWFFIIGAAVAEAISVTVFRIGENRGLLAVLGYVLGFFVVAFYAEGQKYSTLSLSYPIWLVVVALLVSLSAFFVFHDKFTPMWLLGFIFAIAGVIIMQTTIPES